MSNAVFISIVVRHPLSRLLHVTVGNTLPRAMQLLDYRMTYVVNAGNMHASHSLVFIWIQCLNRMETLYAMVCKRPTRYEHALCTVKI